jgi:hypothetical protein
MLSLSLTKAFNFRSLQLCMQMAWLDIENQYTVFSVTIENSLPTNRLVYVQAISNLLSANPVVWAIMFAKSKIGNAIVYGNPVIAVYKFRTV